MFTMYCLKCDLTTRMEPEAFRDQVPDGKPHCIRCGKPMKFFLSPYLYPEEDEVPIGFPHLLECPTLSEAA